MARASFLEGGPDDVARGPVVAEIHNFDPMADEFQVDRIDGAVVAIADGDGGQDANPVRPWSELRQERSAYTGWRQRAPRYGAGCPTIFPAKWRWSPAARAGSARAWSGLAQRSARCVVNYVADPDGRNRLDVGGGDGIAP